jgi:hydrogenase nickel incorporation protein HypA/HybF
MHELTLALALVDQVEEIRRREKAARAVTVTVTIGEMSGVEREALEFAFPIAVEGTALQTTKLIVEEQALSVLCEVCGRESTPDPRLAHCSHCGSIHVKAISGRDLILKSVELELC